MTGMCFILFGVGGLLLTLLVFPLVQLTTTDEIKRKSRCQLIINKCFRFFIWIAQLCNLATIRIDGIEKLTSIENGLVIANHPTLIDVVILLSLVPNIDCIVKQSLYSSIWLKKVLQAAGYIPNINPEQLIDTCVDRLKNGGKLLIFPEGTRSLPNEMRKFQRGAAIIAINCGCKILPVAITSTPPCLSKEEKWYDIPIERPFIHLDVGNAIDFSETIANCRNDHISARKLTRTLEEYFEKRLYNGLSD